MSRSRYLLLVILECCSLELAHGGKGVTSTGCPATLPKGEDYRQKVFRTIHNEWPPVYSYPGKAPMQESPGWTKYMKEKEANLSRIEDHTWKWERWLEQAQIRYLKNYTEKGWGVGELPAALHEEVAKDFHSKHKDGKGGYDEGVVAGYVAGRRSMIQLDGKARAAVGASVQEQVAKWANVAPGDLELTSMYGIRTYYRDSVLETHVDRCESHILSCVYVVDYKYDSDEPGRTSEPWYMVTDPDLSGERAAVEVKPGQLFFYESAKLPHGRPSVLHGDYSAHIFIHFAPKDWNYHNMDRVYGLPPHWAKSFHEGSEL